jgi:hypothetical protein
LVLYNASGTNVSATYVDRESTTLPLLVDHKLYWIALRQPSEAHFLTAILNAESSNQAIKPFQSTGLLGERDIHKKLLDLPIPTFNQEISLHQRISACGQQANRQAQAAIADPNFPGSGSLARKRAYIRKALEEKMAEIDALVRQLLGLK